MAGRDNLNAAGFSLSLSHSVVSFRNSNGWDRIYFLNIKNWGHDKSVTKNTTTSHRYILAADRWPSCSLLVRKPEEHNEDDHSHRAANTGWAWASALHFTHSGPAGVHALHPPLSHLAWASSWASFSVRLPIKQQASGSSFSLADLFSRIDSSELDDLEVHDRTKPARSFLYTRPDRTRWMIKSSLCKQK